MASVVLASCGAAEEREAAEIEAALEAGLAEIGGGSGETDVEVDPDTGAITVEDDNGRFTSGDDLPRPDWLPGELALPEGFVFQTYIESGTIRSARGATERDPSWLLEFYRGQIEELGWSIDGEILEAPTFFQVQTTTPDGMQLDFEFVNGGLAFVTGRARA